MQKSRIPRYRGTVWIKVSFRVQKIGVHLIYYESEWECWVCFGGSDCTSSAATLQTEMSCNACRGGWSATYLKSPVKLIEKWPLSWLLCKQQILYRIWRQSLYWNFVWFAKTAKRRFLLYFAIICIGYHLLLQFYCVDKSHSGDTFSSTCTPQA